MRSPAPWTSICRATCSARAPTASRCCSPTSGPPTRKSPTPCTPRSTPSMFRKSYANVFTGDANWQAIKIPRGKIYAWEEESTYVRNPPYFEGMTMTPQPVTDVTGARVPGAAGRLGHHRPHLAGRRHRQDQPGREIPGVAGRAAHRLQFLRRAPRQPRSHDARHVRQHPPAQPAGAGHRRRRHRARAHAASRCPSSMPPCATSRKARRWSSSPARNTAPARRATGPPRAPCC